MIDTHIKNGVEYQIGHVTASNNESFDIIVYLRFPTEEDEAAGDDNVKLAGWHFGDYDPAVADQYIED